MDDYTILQEGAEACILRDDREGARNMLSHALKFGADASAAAAKLMAFLGIAVVDQHTYRDGHFTKDHAGNVVGASVPLVSKPDGKGIGP